MTSQTIAIGLTVALLIVMLVMFAVLAQLMSVYARALMAGAPIPMINVIGMKLRRVDARPITNAWIQAKRAGVDVTLADLECHLLSGGDVQHVMAAVIAAKKMGKELDWKQATAIDLAQRDVLEFVTSGAHQQGQDWLTAPVRRQQQRQPMI